MKLLKLNGKNGEERFSKVDEEYYTNLNQYKWYVSPEGYVCRQFVKDGKLYKYYLHRVVTNALDNTLLIDHINHDKLDNRVCNLRLCNPQQNQANKFKQNGEYSSVYKGVTYFKWGKRLKRWLAQIMFNGKHIAIGYYLTEEEAAMAYNKRAVELFGEFSSLNLLNESLSDESK